jgi:hypothetical protein
VRHSVSCSMLAALCSRLPLSAYTQKQKMVELIINLNAAKQISLTIPPNAGASGQSNK